MKKLLTLLFLAIIFIVAGIAIERIWFAPHQSASPDKTPIKRKVLYWVAPMDPKYKRDKPGKSPMGMDLVPVYADRVKSEPGIIKINPSIEHNLGVKIAVVKRKDLSQIIETVGYITVDENNIERLHTYTDGWVRVLNVKTSGEAVRRGQLLFKIYSPKLINAQDELLLALKNDSKSIIKAGERKLLTLGMSQSQINEVVRARRSVTLVNIYAKRDGIVSNLNIREGEYVKPDKEIMTIQDLNHIWIIAEVFARQANWVKAGQPAIATLTYMPGKVWQGKIAYVYPELDAKTHTLRVRLAFPNPNLVLKPNMYANIKIFSKTIKNVITIPSNALIRTGQGDRVILSLGKGRYKAQAVKVGIEADRHYQILSGLKPGDRIVVSAQFLIDSESNLKASLNRMQPTVTPQQLMPQEFIGIGKIQSININQRTLVLDHQPIPALNMPAMKMKLPVAKDININTLKVGMTIHFVLIKKDGHKYLITKINVVNH